MKIAITGHTAGIGAAFARYLSSRGHEIIGISKREGHNIRVIPKIVEMITPCDMWINNAQSGYAQTELLYKVWANWQGSEKMIWNISTLMTLGSKIPTIPGQEQMMLAEYKNQKRALEDATRELKTLSKLPYMIVIRPGSVATSSEKSAGEDSADVDVWVQTVSDFYIMCRENNLWPEEISVGFLKKGIDI